MTLVTFQPRVMLAVEDCSRAKWPSELRLRAPTTAVPRSTCGGINRPGLDCRSLSRSLIRDPNCTKPASHCQITFASCTGFSPRSRASYGFVTLEGFTCFYCLPGECIVASLQDEHFTCLNHGLMAGLGTIGQALYMRLFFHFANLHDGRNGEHLFFRKRYDDICTEWLGGLTILKHKSKIIGEQLGRHIDQLVAAGFLASYMVKKSENRDGFVIVFRPGMAFFEDYERFYRRRQQGELQWAFHDDRQQVSEPLKVAYLFTEKRTGHPANSIAFVPSKDV